MGLENLRCYYLNVRGIKSDKRKRLSIFIAFKSKYPGIIFMQETHNNTVEVESLWKPKSGGEIIFSHGTATSKGVTILLSLNFKYKIETPIKSPDGRYIIAKIEFCSSKYIFTNVYTST